VKLLVDMNLSPSWINRLARHGFDAVHWSTVGAATAPDVEILTWATEHQFVVVTNDLDFSGNPCGQCRRHTKRRADQNSGLAL